MPDQRDAAMALMRQQKFHEALPIFLRLIDDNPDAGLHYMAGQCLRFTEKLPEAVSHLTKAITLDPDDASFYLALGIALQLSEKYDLAIETLETAVKLDPAKFSSHNSLGLTYRKIGHIKKAVACYERAMEVLMDEAFKELEKDPKRYFKDEYRDGKKLLVVLPHAQGKIEQLLRSEPRHAIVLNNIGECLATVGEIEEARIRFREAIKYTPAGYDYPAPSHNLASLPKA